MKQKDQAQFAGRLFTNEFVYEFRPIFCFAVGIYAVVHAKGSAMMGICGLLLLGAGMMIYSLRRSARQRADARRR
jgi:hypothetical protein